MKPAISLLLSRCGISTAILPDIARRHGLKELSIFGSVLRDDFSDASDIDVLFELLPGQTLTIERFIALRDELQTLFQRPVDLVEKPLLRNPYRRAEILRTREVLYATPCFYAGTHSL